MKIVWDDSWNSEEKGYFHTIYYPEGGTSSGDGMGYIYTSFWRRGELKVEDGHVKYEISDGEEELGSGDLGEVANPFRMVKYLVIRPSRASANELIDLRLHDIVLWAGQDTSLEEPEECDGCILSNVASGEAVALMEDFSSMLDTDTVSWWTGGWPLLHMMTNCTLQSGESYSFETTIDILGSISIVNFELETPDDDHLNDEQLETLATQGIDDFKRDVCPIETMLIFSAFVTYTIIQYYLATMIVVFSPATLVGLSLLATAFALIIWTALLSVTDGVLSGRLTPGTAIAIVLWGIIPMLAVGCVFDHILYNKVFAQYWQTRNLGWGFRGVGLILLTFYLCAIQFFLLSLALLLLVFLYSLSIAYYDMAAA